MHCIYRHSCLHFIILLKIKWIQEDVMEVEVGAEEEQVVDVEMVDE